MIVSKCDFVISSLSEPIHWDLEGSIMVLSCQTHWKWLPSGNFMA